MSDADVGESALSLNLRVHLRGDLEAVAQAHFCPHMNHARKRRSPWLGMGRWRIAKLIAVNVFVEIVYGFKSDFLF